MIRKIFLTVYHTVVLWAAIFGNLEPAQKKQLLRHLGLQKAYDARVIKQVRVNADRELKKLSLRIAQEIRHGWRN